jgi:hypothetical protein
MIVSQIGSQVTGVAVGACGHGYVETSDGGILRPVNDIDGTDGNGAIMTG